jgi:hypothetical protein
LTLLNPYISILPYSNQPLSSHILLHLLKDYKRPYDKITELINKGLLIQLRRGLYLPGPGLPVQQPEPFLIANHLFGPSYVSFDSALYYWGFIPEKVSTTISASHSSSKLLITAAGTYRYIKLNPFYYPLGILSHELEKNQVCLLATPEKALMDKIIETPMLQIRSLKDAQEYLTEDLRIDLSDLKKLDLDQMSSWIKYASKKKTLSMILKFLGCL